MAKQVEYIGVRRSQASKQAATDNTNTCRQADKQHLPNN